MCQTAVRNHTRNYASRAAIPQGILENSKRSTLWEPGIERVRGLEACAEQLKTRSLCRDRPSLCVVWWLQTTLFCSHAFYQSQRRDTFLFLSPVIRLPTEDLWPTILLRLWLRNAFP